MYADSFFLGRLEGPSVCKGRKFVQVDNTLSNKSFVVFSEIGGQGVGDLPRFIFLTRVALTSTQR